MNLVESKFLDECTNNDDQIENMETIEEDNHSQL